MQIHALLNRTSMSDSHPKDHHTHASALHATGSLNGPSYSSPTAAVAAQSDANDAAGRPSLERQLAEGLVYRHDNEEYVDADPQDAQQEDEQDVGPSGNLMLLVGALHHIASANGASHLGCVECCVGLACRYVGCRCLGRYRADRSFRS